LPEDFDLFVRRLLGQQPQPALEEAGDRPQGDVGMERRAASPDGNSSFRDHVITQIRRHARLADAGWSA